MKKKVTTSKKRKKVLPKRKFLKVGTPSPPLADEFVDLEVVQDITPADIAAEVARIKLLESRKYPSPKPKDKTFSHHWEEFVMDVSKRENFKPGHLSQLSVLCDLYVEYDKLTENIARNGYTYLSEGRNGTQVKARPEVVQINRTRSEIRAYARTLGLLLMKDKDLGTKEEEAEWE